MFNGYIFTEEEREEIASDLAGGTRTAYGSGWGGVAIVRGEDEEEGDC